MIKTTRRSWLQTLLTGHAGESHPFPLLRWVAGAWLAIWVPVYTAHWGWRNFLALCDLAVALGCIGLWRASPLLLSSQALPSIVIGLVWSLDTTTRLVTGKHLLGGTEYMWDSRYPLSVRLMSLFHVALPIVLVFALRRVRYDRRALAFQSLLTFTVLIASRFVGHSKNLNYAFRDPFLDKSWGPAAFHLLVIGTGAVLLVYLPTHLALARWLGSRKPGRAPGLL